MSVNPADHDPRAEELRQQIERHINDAMRETALPSLEGLDPGASPAQVQAARDVQLAIYQGRVAANVEAKLDGLVGQQLPPGIASLKANVQVEPGGTCRVRLQASAVEAAHQITIQMNPADWGDG